MKRIIEYFFPSSILTDYEFIASMADHNIICIDGNIALYETKNLVDLSSRSLVPRDVFKHCTQVADAVKAFKRVIVFDGLAPIQKLPEQLKRRKKRYDKYTDLQKDKAFDLSSTWYNSFISDCEDLFTDNGWKVISHTTIGEGEQKIADYVRYLSNVITEEERYNIICWSKDWDIFVILLNIELASNVAVYLEMALPDMYQLISINKTQAYLESCDVSPLHFMACCIVFGCDFFPGLQYMKLTPENLSVLINTQPFITFDGCNIIQNLFMTALYHLKHDSYDYRSMSSGEVQDTASSKIILYSNVKTIPVNVEIEDCGGSCLMCDTNKHCTSHEMELACYQYINMLTWTLKYFTGSLDYKMSDRSTDVYISHVSPSISSMMRWLETYEFDNDEQYVDIIQKTSYAKAMEQGLDLQFYELQQCRYVETYQAPIICKSFRTIDVFRQEYP